MEIDGRILQKMIEQDLRGQNSLCSTSASPLQSTTVPAHISLISEHMKVTQHDGVRQMHIQMAI